MNICTFKIGTPERHRLEAFAELMASEFDNAVFTVKDVYFDLGAGVMWTTICPEYHSKVTDKTTSYQMLYPKQWNKICFGTIEEFFETFEELKPKTYEMVNQTYLDKIGA